MMKKIDLSILFITVGMTALTGCSGGPTERSSVQTGTPSVAAQSAQLDEVITYPLSVFHYETVDDYTEQPSLAVIATVTSEAKGKDIGGPVVKESERELSLDVEEVLFGEAGSTLNVVDYGSLSDGRPIRVEDGLRIEVGDRGIFAIHRSGDDGTLRFAGPQAPFLLDGDDIRDTPRKDKFVRSIEKMRKQEVKDAVKAARKSK